MSAAQRSQERGQGRPDSHGRTSIGQQRDSGILGCQSLCHDSGHHDRCCQQSRSQTLREQPRDQRLTVHCFPPSASSQEPSIRLFPSIDG